jgi:hypothetical protein
MAPIKYSKLGIPLMGQFYQHFTPVFLCKDSLAFDLYFTNNCAEILLDTLGDKFCASYHNFMFFA